MKRLNTLCCALCAVAALLFASAAHGFSLAAADRRYWAKKTTRTTTRTTNRHFTNHRSAAAASSRLLFSSAPDDSESLTVKPRPDPSILLSARDDTTQRLGFIAICASLGMGTILMIQLLTVLEAVLPAGWYAAWRDYTWPVPMGLLFAAAGVTHFELEETYTAFVPPRGTWGNLWQVPAPGSKLLLNMSEEQYHCYWTGIAEIVLGVGMILSALHAIPLTVDVPAMALFFLIIAVTPANIYMATHDIQPPKFPPVPYPEGHVVRGVMQCVLLSLFWKLAHP